MLSPSQERELEQRVAQVRDYMRTRRLKPTDLVELGGEDQRTDNAPEQRRRAFGVERTWELMAHLGVRHSDLERALPHEFCPPAVAEADFRVRRRRSKTQVIAIIEEPPHGAGVNSSMIPVGAEVGTPAEKAAFGVSNADDAEIAAERMKARFAAHEDGGTS
jgi:hypothetical protein